MTFELFVSPAKSQGWQFVKIRYDGVTSDEDLLDEWELRDLAQEMLDASVKLCPEILDQDKAEFYAEGVRQCCDWLRKEGYGELADKMINFV